MTKTLGLSREHRLRHAADFRRVYDRRRSVSDNWLLIYGCENALAHARIGLSVSRKFGGAVQRNRLRRLYREAFRLSRSELPGGIDVILIPRTSTVPTLEQLRQSVLRLIKQVARKLTPRTE